MKKLLTIIIIALLPIFVFGQKDNFKQRTPHATYDTNVNEPLTADERAKIIEVYGDSAEKVVFGNPHRLKTIKQILRNRVVIVEHADKDLSSLKTISEVALSDTYKMEAKSGAVNSKNFNPLKYDLGFYSYSDSIKNFRIDNTQYVVTIMPQHSK